MALLNIEPDENMSFHNALNDAWYTALVFRTLPDPSAVLNYARQPRELIHGRRSSREKTPGEIFDSVREALASESAIHPTCPRCGRVLALDGEYIKQSADKYIAIAKCKNHGRLLIRLHFRIDDDGRKIMTRATAPATSSTYSAAAIPPRTTRTSGRRFSTCTSSRRSRRWATRGTASTR